MWQRVREREQEKERARKKESEALKPEISIFERKKEQLTGERERMIGKEREEVRKKENK